MLCLILEVLGSSLYTTPFSAARLRRALTKLLDITNGAQKSQGIQNNTHYPLYIIHYEGHNFFLDFSNIFHMFYNFLL